MLSIIRVLFFTTWLAESSLDQCEADLFKWAQAIFSRSPDNYRDMVEYSGKGINDLGLYFECNDVPSAKYVIFEISEIPAVVLGLCLPDSCSIPNYWEILGIASDSPFLTTLKTHTNSNLFKKIAFPSDSVLNASDMSASAILMIFSCTILIFLAIIGTSVELTHLSLKHVPITNSDSSDEISQKSLEKPLKKRAKKYKKLLQYLMCFSLYTNILKIFATKEEKKKDPLDCLNAVRVLSISWVCLAHTEILRGTDSVVLNIDTARIFFRHFESIIVNNGPFAVDSFFWLSGFLQGYLMTLQISTSTRKVNWPMILVHRFIRILPLYMFVVLFSWSLAKHIGNGPKWYNADYIMHKDCADYFWAMPLFINNFVLSRGLDSCLIGSWYLPNDMQFFMVSLPIMYLYIKHSRIFGWGLLSVCIAFSIIANGTISYDQHLHAKIDNPENRQYFDDLYDKPYCRIAPYCIGLLGGFVFHAHRLGRIKGNRFDPLASSIAHLINTSQKTRIFCYGLGLFLMNFFMIIQWDAYQSENNWSRSQNAAYFAFQRFTWGFSINCFFLPILMGHASWLRGFLQSNWWMPLAKLVFAVFLMHTVVGQIFFMSQPVSFYFSQTACFVDALFILVVTFLLAIPVILCIESPVINLEKILFNR